MHRIEPYQWLGAGAIAVGIGAALAAGSGVAHADDGGTGSAGPSATGPSSTGSTKPARKNTPKIAVAGSAKKPSSAKARSARPSPRTPSPAAPSAEVLAAALAATTRPATAVSTPRAMAVANSAEEVARERSIADINMSVGWIPGVGTVINGLSLVSDFADFTLAALRGDAADMRDEIGDMALDVVGMIPVVGAPVAATIYRATAPVVTPPNHAPTAVNDSFTMDENAQLTGNVLTNDTDADGDVLTAAVGTGPSHGTLTLNDNGSFTYTPTENFYGTDTFSYTISDGKGGNALGTVTVTVKSVDPAPVVAQQPYSVDPADPVTGKIKGRFNVTDDDPLTYTMVTGPDPTLGVFELDEQTGEWSFTPYPRTRVLAGYFSADSPAAVKISFTVTATDGISTTAPIAVSENIAASQSAAIPLPAGITPIKSLLDPGTGDAYIFGYSGDPNTFPGNATFSYLAAIVHADGSYDTLTGNHAAGAAYQTFVVGDTTYLMTLTGTADSGFQTHLSEIRPTGLTPVGDALPGVGLHALGETELPSTFSAGDTTYIVTMAVDRSTTYLTGLGADGLGPTTSIPGQLSPQGQIVLGDTTYVLTVTSDYDTGHQTHITALTPDGVTSYAQAVPGFDYRDPIFVGDMAYLVTETGDYQSGYETHLTAFGPTGVAPTITISGRAERDPIVIGDMAYLVTQTGDYQSGYETHLTALSPYGVAPTITISGTVERDPIVIGDMAYLVTQTGDYQSGYETHVTALSPYGATPTFTIPGDVEHDPIVIGDITYLLVTPYSRIVTHVLALTPSGAVPVGSLPGVLSGDPIVVGDTTYLITETGEDAAETWQTWATTLTPTFGGITVVGDPIAGRRFGRSPIVVGDTTYLVTETWNSTIGSETSLTAIGPNGLAPIRVGIPGRMWSDRFVVVLGDTTYLATTTSYYYPGDQVNTYEHTYLTPVGPDGATPTIGPVPGYPVTGPIVVGDTTYLAMESDDPSTGYQVRLISVTSDGFTPIAEPIPGRVNPDEDLQTITVGGTTYLITQTGDDNSGYQRYLTAIGPGGVEPAGDPIPGWASSANDFQTITVGGTTYLVTTTGDGDAGHQTHLTALGSDGVTSQAVIPGRTDAINGVDFAPIVVGDITYLVTVTGEYDTVESYFTALGPDGVTTTAGPIAGEVRWWPGDPMTDAVFVVGDTTYVVVVQHVAYDENSYTNGDAHLVALTPTGVVQVGEPVSGFTSVITVGDTTYVLTTAGVWAVAVDHDPDGLAL